jgi:hypothetical protein
MRIIFTILAGLLAFVGFIFAYIIAIGLAFGFVDALFLIGAMIL